MFTFSTGTFNSLQFFLKPCLVVLKAGSSLSLVLLITLFLDTELGCFWGFLFVWFYVFVLSLCFVIFLNSVLWVCITVEPILERIYAWELPPSVRPVVWLLDLIYSGVNGLSFVSIVIPFPVKQVPNSLQVTVIALYPGAGIGCFLVDF